MTRSNTRISQTRVGGIVRRPLSLVAALCLAIGLTACASTDEPEPPPPSEFDQGAVEQPEPEPTRPAATMMDLKPIFFDFDRSTIRPDASTTLRGNAEQILGGESVITIEGHTDERGSEEYNLALGERRADSAKKYLVNLGIPSGRFRTVSYGEAKPAVQGHNEAAWRWNRRAEFRSGG